jgi:hypothetical protein
LLFEGHTGLTEQNVKNSSAAETAQHQPQPPSLWQRAAGKLSETVRLLREYAARLRAQDSASIEADRIEQRANELDRLAVQGELDLARKWEEARIDDWTRRRQYSRDWALKNTDQAIQFAVHATRGAVLINGGAMVALLAFLGNVWAKGSPVGAFAGSFQWFAIGLLSAIVTSGLSYGAQYCYGENDEKGEAVPWILNLGKGFHVGALVLFLISLGAFGCGSYDAFDVLQRTNPPTATEEIMPEKRPPARPTAPPAKEHPLLTSDRSVSSGEPCNESDIEIVRSTSYARRHSRHMYCRRSRPPAVRARSLLSHFTDLSGFGAPFFSSSSFLIASRS